MSSTRNVVTIGAVLAACFIISACNDDDSESNNNVNTATCGSGNCSGCCEGNTCMPGNADSACGRNGQACQACTGGSSCVDGSCETAPQCQPGSCSGCCDGDTCLPGNQDSACGTGGYYCQACTGNQSCVNGVCVSECGPDTCLGCCDPVSGACLSGNQDDACGYGGQDCSTCGGNEACSNGSCVNVTCQSTCQGCCSGDTCLGGGSSTACGTDGYPCVDCGQGFACDFGECVVDPASRWDVVLLNGEISITDPDGDSWDIFGGLPDPFVTFVVGGVMEPTSQAMSEAVDDTITPSWNVVILTDVSARAIFEHFCYQVFDSDIDYPEEISDEICLGLGDYDFGEGTFVEDSGSYHTIRFRIRPH